MLPGSRCFLWHLEMKMRMCNQARNSLAWQWPVQRIWWTFSDTFNCFYAAVFFFILVIKRKYYVTEKPFSVCLEFSYSKWLFNFAYYFNSYFDICSMIRTNMAWIKNTNKALFEHEFIKNVIRQVNPNNI